MMKSAFLVLLAALCLTHGAGAQTRIADVAAHEGDAPVRLVGYGLVTGLDGTGDRSMGGSSGAIHTVASVANLLRRFNVEVPAERLRLRNVAAVLVTAEVSPYLRKGGRFDVQVSSLGDATSLTGGSLWITPLVTDPDGPALATAQGVMAIQPQDDQNRGWRGARSASGRVADGGIVEQMLSATVPVASAKLLLREPDLRMAVRIAAAVKAAFGDSSAKADDPGSVTLKPPASFADNLPGFLAGVDTLPIEVTPASRIVIDARSGIVAAGGDVRVGRSVVSLRGITVRIRSAAPDSEAAARGEVSLGDGATVQDVAAGLHALGAEPGEIAAVFDALRSAGAIRATVVVR